ncbi:MAG: outer rane biosis protein BamB [Verrucomicrobiales bacterium]|nr:outer rane biosis protein BamB [Verrucomicrobiales bacterium]
MPLDFSLKKTLSRFLIAALCGAALGGSAAPFSGQISGWRGDGSGHFENATPPIDWDGESGKNILWKTKVGLSKFSSPALVQDRVLVVAEPARLICLDATRGKILWERTNGFADLPTPTEPKQLRNEQPNTTPTPISDGQLVYVVFGSGIIACYDLLGQRQWIQYLEAGPGLDFGRSSSPALSGGKLLVSIHHLFALDVKTGRVLWKNEKVLERYGTPLATKIAGVEILVTPSGQIVRLDDGALIFTATDLNFASPIVSDSAAYFIGTSASAVSLSKANAERVGKSLWKTDLDGSYYASPIYAGGLLYTASNEGNFSIINAADGKVVVTRELGIGSASGRPDLPNANIYSSLALAGPYLFLSNDIGDTLVLEPGKDYKELKHNHLGEGFSGAPVFAGGRMYLRTKERLYCIGQK